MSLPSSRCPATDAASCEAPSIMSPSLQKTYVKWSMISCPGSLYRAARCASAIASPTAFMIPCPSGPVVHSTPGVRAYSGCPGVLLSHCRKCCKSSSETSYPVKNSIAYCSIDACPFDSTKRSRLNHSGFPGLYRRNRVHSTYASGASAIGVPGCPEFAFCTASIASVRIVSIHNWSNSACRALPERLCDPVSAPVSTCDPMSSPFPDPSTRLLRHASLYRHSLNATPPNPPGESAKYAIPRPPNPAPPYRS